MYTKGKLEATDLDSREPNLWIGGTVIAVCEPIIRREEADNAERLRDCWNACDGIENPTELRQQRDDLLVACEAVLKDDENYSVEPPYWAKLKKLTTKLLKEIEHA